MDKKELIALVKKIIAGEGEEREIDEMIELFLKNVPDPEADDYIFQLEYEGLSAEDIVEKALNYKVIQLPSSNEKS